MCKTLSVTKLLDLPLGLLAHIAALVSTGPLCKYAALPFQVLCQHDHWRNIKGVRESCKVLWDACKLANGGVECRSIEMHEEDEKFGGLMSTGFSITIAAPPERAFANLTKLKELALENIGMDLIVRPVEKLGGFERLELVPRLLVSSAEFLDITQFPSSKSLQNLKLEMLGAKPVRKQVQHLLSFQHNQLSFLQLDAVKAAPVIPNKVLRTLSNLLWRGYCSTEDITRSLFSQLKQAPLLESLCLSGCEMNHTGNPEVNTDLRKVKILQLESRSPVECSQDFVLAVYLKRFPALRELKLYVFNPRLWPLTDIRAMLAISSSMLTRLRLTIHIRITREDADLLSRVKFFKDFELEFSIMQTCQRAPIWVRALLAVRKLTALEISQNVVKHINTLARIPKLRSVKFCDCNLKRGEVEKLKRYPGNLKMMESKDIQFRRAARNCPYNFF